MPRLLLLPGTAGRTRFGSYFRLSSLINAVRRSVNPPHRRRAKLSQEWSQLAVSEAGTLEIAVDCPRSISQFATTF